MAPLIAPRVCAQALTAIASFVFVASAGATQVVQLDTPALVRGSSDIVVAEVAATRSHWNAGHTRIVTDVTVRVEEALKGASQPTLTLTQLGGDVDGLHLEVEGSPVFRPGERSVLFVWRDSSGRAQVNGLAQGKFDIERDPSSGRAIVRRQLGAMSLVDPHGARVQRAAAASAPVALEEFKAEIRRVLGSASTPAGK